MPQTNSVDVNRFAVGADAPRRPARPAQIAAFGSHSIYEQEVRVGSNLTPQTIESTSNRPPDDGSEKLMDLFAPSHLLIVLLIVLVIFGPSKIGDVGGALGKAIKDFKRAMNEPDSDNKPSDKNTVEIKPSDAKTEKIS